MQGHPTSCEIITDSLKRTTNLSKIAAGDDDGMTMAMAMKMVMGMVNRMVMMLARRL